MKFAIVSADRAHNVSLKMNHETDDATSFLSWLEVFEGGIHLSYEALRESGFEYLRHFDMIMMSGHPSYIVDIIKIAKYLKDKETVTVFYPEGSAQLYDNSIRGFHKEYYEAWNACDILSIAEEDKVQYYRSFVGHETIVKFIHVPITAAMADGEFIVKKNDKTNAALVYGDNNPNHPMIATACAWKIGLDILGIDTGGKENAEIFSRMFPGSKFFYTTKHGLNRFLRYLGRTVVHFYPTEWIGTARQQVSCAVVGTPCIGNRDSHTQQRLFPELACYIYDVEGMCEMGRRLLSNESFYNKIVKTAFENSSFYNIENTKKRFLSAYNDACAMKKARKASLAT